ncbi:alkyl hydroperoxide reductase [Sporosarcina sp. P12(2017)]|uniref:TlpA disulfide reductase family protein n=1 Tax=unclassified Sporosarcina TaxID=2647733 RepID=UPI000C166037|nr:MULTISPECIES: redoxin domain-containing protein [unclassified Sporosarcina]PIC56016.1 alkyl hydroperoxide reductase [Sporosarcina sp. P10]PIC59314.1 alkyl hydroperoxide reductase [Sporosarcina sp. P12(2017)]
MKKTIFVAIIMVMLGWTAYEFIFASNEKVTQEEDPIEVEDSDKIGILRGELAPDFELTTLDGDIVKLSDYKGKRVMLNFWATWCPPCRAEMPDMQRFQSTKDVQVLAVNLTETESDPSNAQRFVDELNLTFTVPLDKESVVSNEYNVMAYPTTYMIDSNGRIQFIMMGAMNYDFMVQQFEMMQ